MLTKAKILQIFGHLSNNIDNILHSSPRRIYALLEVLQEGSSKSPKTAAHICKYISEIPGISQMFWYEALQNFKIAAKNQRRNRKFLKTSRGSFLSQTYPCRPKKIQKIWCDSPFNIKICTDVCPGAVHQTAHTWTEFAQICAMNTPSL